MTQAASEEKVTALVGKALGDWSSILSGALVVIGDKLGLYTALAEAGPLNSEEQAARTGTAERYVREWLRAMAAGGYITYDKSNDRYSLSPEQAIVLTDANSPTFILGGYQGMTAATRSMPKLLERFRTGEGLGAGDDRAGVTWRTAWSQPLWERTLGRGRTRRLPPGGRAP